MKFSVDKIELMSYVEVLKKYLEELEVEPDKAILSFYAILPLELLGGKVLDEYNMWRTEYLLDILKRVIKYRMDVIEKVVKGEVLLEDCVVENEWFLSFVHYEKK